MIDLTPKCLLKLSFTVPGVPNQKRSATPHAIKMTTNDGRTFWKGVAAKNTKNKPVENNIQQWVMHAGWPAGAALHAGPVYIKMKAFFPIRKTTRKWELPMYETEQVLYTGKPDIDRLLNMVQDALTGFVWVDDSQVCGYPGSGKWYSPIPRTEITIWLMRPQVPASHEEYKKMIAEAE